MEHDSDSILFPHESWHFTDFLGIWYVHIGITVNLCQLQNDIFYKTVHISETKISELILLKSGWLVGAITTQWKVIEAYFFLSSEDNILSFKCRLSRFKQSQCNILFWAWENGPKCPEMAGTSYLHNLKNGWHSKS